MGIKIPLYSLTYSNKFGILECMKLYGGMVCNFSYFPLYHRNKKLKRGPLLFECKGVVL